MMDVLTQRLMLQRETLTLINEAFRGEEQLCGLSVNALDRWLRANRLSPDSPVAKLLTKIADQLGCLTVRSQETVDDTIGLPVADVKNSLEELMLVIDSS